MKIFIGILLYCKSAKIWRGEGGEGEREEIKEVGGQKILFEVYPCLQYINFDHRLFRRVGKTRNLIFFSFKLQNENFWIWIWISYVLKEFETFIFDENFLKARDSTASMYRETHFRSFEPFLYCIKYFFLLE